MDKWTKYREREALQYLPLNGISAPHPSFQGPRAYGKACMTRVEETHGAADSRKWYFHMSRRHMCGFTDNVITCRVHEQAQAIQNSNLEERKWTQSSTPKEAMQIR